MFRVEGSRFRVQGSGFGGWGLHSRRGEKRSTGPRSTPGSSARPGVCSCVKESERESERERERECVCEREGGREESGVGAYSDGSDRPHCKS